MKNNFQKIETDLNRLHDIQLKQLASFEDNGLPDLEKQSEERRIKVNELLKDIRIFIESAKERPDVLSKSMLTFISEKVTILLEQNKALEIKVTAFKDEIKKGMKQISKGSQVISAYKSSYSVLNRPKVISLSN